MSREALIHVAFVAKAPANSSQWNRIFDLATRLLDRSERGAPESPGRPANVIPFPACVEERERTRERKRG